MDATQRLYLQHKAMQKTNGIGVNTSDSILIKSSNFTIENEIDWYVIQLIETADKRRYLLDKGNYDRIMDSIEKDAQKQIEKAVDNICKKFSK